MPTTYVEVQIRADPPLEEELAGVLSQLGFEGFWEDGPLLKCYIRSARWEDRLLEEVGRVTRLVLHSSADNLPEISVRNVPVEDWNAQWESTLKPVRVTDRIIIAPSWHHVSPAPGGIVLTIDPKMSFGTGYHESTRLMIRLVEETVRPGVQFLDVGTGTGVLAIAAARLGAGHALGIDIDEWSYENARENIHLNGVEHLVTVQRCSIANAPLTEFDVVAANIQRSVIEAALPEMLRRLAPSGALLLAGLLMEDRDPMFAALRQNGLTPTHEICENEWIALAAHRE